MPGNKKQFGKDTDLGITLGVLEYVVIQKCRWCKGTGTRGVADGIPPGGSVVCPYCEGDGELIEGKIYAVD